jgi:hypothetical protein
MLGKFPIDKFSKDTVTAYMSILESEAGIMPRAIHHIFQGLQRQVEMIFDLRKENFIIIIFSMLIIQLKLLILNYIMKN